MKPALIDDATVARLLTPADVLAVVASAFTDPVIAPQRLVAESDEADDQTRTLLAMPALRRGGLATVKIVTVLGGRDGGLSSHLVAFSQQGDLLAVIEAHHLTALRTAAASVLAAKALGAGEARHLAVLGAGRQARAQVAAYAAAMPLETITVWARRLEAAAELADFAKPMIGMVRVASTPAETVQGADIVTCATASELPLVRGSAVASGAHVDLVGGFRPSMREADDALMARATIVADTPAALTEAGDLVGPIAGGAIERGHVHLLADILAGRVIAPRREITVFKSVGHAGEDFAVAELLLARLGLIDGPTPGGARASVPRSGQP
jgi:ornithine cyclodeaminase